ncbi:hypothetical protein Bca4012_041121 [Brassica carinata]|uniref:Uncharacterized protein n=1 Tax=Brassica carinata TaxID=52824 RepID=A0A8X7UI98_BRACI|nr:hypothetical protein Bca52824_061136 [Brassica carinata]
MPGSSAEVPVPQLSFFIEHKSVIDLRLMKIKEELKGEDHREFSLIPKAFGLLELEAKVDKDSELADVEAVSAGNNYELGNMIAEAMAKTPGFGERKSQYLDDIAALVGGETND